MKDNIEIVESLEDCGFLPEGVTETIQNEAKEQKGACLVCYLVHWVQADSEIV